MISAFLAAAMVFAAPPGMKCGPPPNGNRPWVSDSDYPEEAREKGMRGEVRFELDVSAQGCVTKCTIIESSGYDLLDRKTCALMIFRARFKMEKDTSGNPVGGRVIKTMTWK